MSCSLLQLADHCRAMAETDDDAHRPRWLAIAAEIDDYLARDDSPSLPGLE